jgi:hypothetical protein
MMYYGGSGTGIIGNQNLIYDATNNQINFYATEYPSNPQFTASGYASSFYNATTNRTYYVFTSASSGSITTVASTNVEYFAIGGGGGGGADSNDSGRYSTGGGGGAGGLQTNSSVFGVSSQVVQISPLSTGTYNIVVGAGGTGGQYNVTPSGSSVGYGAKGGNTTFSLSGGSTLLTAVGGGGGGPGSVNNSSTGQNGGSGGGGGGMFGTFIGGGTASQGFAGGGTDSGLSCGGGGGSGSVGQTPPSPYFGGNGGSGLVYPASGTGSTGYAAGGAGAAYTTGSVGGTGGSAGGSTLGGSGGGGGYRLVNGGNAVANTGSGGGGGGNSPDQAPNHAIGGNGSGGVFIISFSGVAIAQTGILTNEAQIGINATNSFYVAGSKGYVHTGITGPTGSTNTLTYNASNGVVSYSNNFTANSALAASVGTILSVDALQYQFNSTAGSIWPLVRGNSATPAITNSGYASINGQSPIMFANLLATLSSSTWSTFITTNMSKNGDSLQATIQDSTNSKIYRATFIAGPTGPPVTGTIIIERLL